MAPTPPESRAASASRTIASFYSAVNRRRVGRASTSASGAAGVELFGLAGAPAAPERRPGERSETGRSGGAAGAPGVGLISGSFAGMERGNLFAHYTKL